MKDIRYPIGTFEKPATFDEENLKECLGDIRRLPSVLREAVRGLNEAQLNTPYREGGWTVAQVVHHLADASMNAFVRTKWTLTEETPSIKPFDENAWAETTDALSLSIEFSLQLLEGLHARWVQLLESLKLATFKRAFYHEETKATMDIYTLVAMYAWHGKHHTAQIQQLRKRKGW